MAKNYTITANDPSNHKYAKMLEYILNETPGIINDILGTASSAMVRDIVSGVDGPCVEVVHKPKSLEDYRAENANATGYNTKYYEQLDWTME